ncbi:MFS transporter [Siccirubricoccus sp. KC 17139]|uniref:MFS transporter n=1 Tax=Siccirubricoccus soli TaxID=2899147 RepID=A0ABT1D4P1_9PROT|nr:MFS transporter [Siccirubricoccus soli]MCO6416892.1 MFS transporter [Siccirubricoccus soli]MCP2683027.1 MFS transporter [Siccirubricoccus soli]
MSSTAVDAAGAPAPDVGPPLVPGGPLEAKHMRSAPYRNAVQQGKLTRTHWHIAWANGLGWGFDGMDGAIFALVAPMVMQEFAVTLPEYRSGVQIAMLVGIVGLYLWPWLADQFGRRTLLAVNIAMFSLMMPLVALAPNWGFFVAAYAIVRFALNGEWAIGSMLVAETWPARLRGMIVSVDRSAWGVGAALAGTITAVVVGQWGWRAAFVLPAVVALLAVYVRFLCPESPYWVRTMDRKRRIREALRNGHGISAEDRQWIGKAEKVGVSQLFLPDMRRSTLLATFVACTNVIAFSTVGLWMPLFLKEAHGWTAAEYGSFYVAWGLIGVLGIIGAGWIIDRFGRRLGFVLMLVEGAVFLTLWTYTSNNTLLWVYGLLWSIGFLGVWGPATTYTAEMYPTRIRGVGNGFSWALAFFTGYVLWPFVSVWIREATGSFQLAFLLIPVVMLGQAAVVWWWSPENAGKDLDGIHV